MVVTYKIQAESIDQESRAQLIEDPGISSRLDNTLPYLCLDMFLKSPYLSVNQMVIAAGSPFGIIEKFQQLVNDYLARDLIEAVEIEDSQADPDETFYRIADRNKAESLFLEITKNKY